MAWLHIPIHNDRFSRRCSIPLNRMRPPSPEYYQYLSSPFLQTPSLLQSLALVLVLHPWLCYSLESQWYQPNPPCSSLILLSHTEIPLFRLQLVCIMVSFTKFHQVCGLEPSASHDHLTESTYLVSPFSRRDEVVPQLHSLPISITSISFLWVQGGWVSPTV